MTTASGSRQRQPTRSGTQGSAGGPRRVPCAAPTSPSRPKRGGSRQIRRSGDWDQITWLRSSSRSSTLACQLLIPIRIRPIGAPLLKKIIHWHPPPWHRWLCLRNLPTPVDRRLLWIACAVHLEHIGTQQVYIP